MNLFTKVKKILNYILKPNCENPVLIVFFQVLPSILLISEACFLGSFPVQFPWWEVVIRPEVSHDYDSLGSYLSHVSGEMGLNSIKQLDRDNQMIMINMSLWWGN